MQAVRMYRKPSELATSATLDSCLLLRGLGERLLNSMLELQPILPFHYFHYVCVYMYVGVLILCEHVEARGQY